MAALSIPTPRWALPLYAETMPDGGPIRYRGAWGGRASGKSHEFAGMVVEAMAANPDCNVLCVREIQKSLALSAKKLIEAKIEAFGLGHMFEVLKTEIRRIGGRGICIFVGMQDHTADSVKSLEGFDIAWIEEAQSLSQRSLDLLIPTIRKNGSQIWATWNPNRRDDPIERIFRGAKPRSDAIVVRANYTDNPFLPDTIRREAESAKEADPDSFGHTWLGEYEGLGSKVVIPLLWVQAAIGLADDLGLEVTGKVIAGLDVAGGEDSGDCNAFAARKGIALISVESWNGLDTSLTTAKAAMMAVKAGAQDVFYDCIGVGEGITGEWAAMGRRGDRPQGVEFTPWAGGSSPLWPDKRTEPNDPRSPLNKDQYENIKAQAWFYLRKRFENAFKARQGRPYQEDMLISIPRNLQCLVQLEGELTQPQHKTSGRGKTMVDKQPDRARSPNLADAVVMAYFPLDSGPNYTLSGIF